MISPPAAAMARFRPCEMLLPGALSIRRGRPRIT